MVPSARERLNAAVFRGADSAVILRRLMRITWYGHAAFAIEGKNSRGEDRKVILDPYNYPACGGYLPIDETCDVVSVSHENAKYHSDLSAIRGEPEVLRALEIAGASRELKGIRFDAHRVFEDRQGNGPNAMVRFELDGVRIAHQGDLGHPLDAKGVEFLRGVDVLLALAGGAPTIALDDLVKLIRAVHPAFVVPMHFKTHKVNLKILPLDRFLDTAREFPRIEAGTSSFEISREGLPASPTVLVLQHAR